jgi:hypothetical protein
VIRPPVCEAPANPAHPGARNRVLKDANQTKGTPPTMTINKTLANTGRRLAAGPVAATVLDQDALAVLSELGLVASCRLGLQLNVTQAHGSAIAALARGDFRRAAGCARIKRTAA